MKRSVQYALTLSFFACCFGPHVSASSSNVLISQVQAGAASGQVAAATQEFVTLYNNGAQDIEVTNWCLSNSTKPLEHIACLVPRTAAIKLYLPAHTYAVVVSDNFAAQHSAYRADVTFPTTNNVSGSIAAGVDTVSLKNAADVVVDAVAWSTSAFSPSGGFVLQRHIGADLTTMIDTDVVADFSKIQGVVLPQSSVYEVVTIVDVCPNIDLIQETIPAGFLQDDKGDCYRDACTNLDGLQLTIPDEYVRRGINDCLFDYVSLQVTELLPNVAGSDTGHEYVEIYNPGTRAAFLVGYTLSIGDKMYHFPLGLKIEPGQYMGFYNNDILFTLPNTASRVTLLGDDGSLISQSDAYDSPKENMAWALIGGVWQYTNQPTFGASNVASVLEDAVATEIVNDMPPCPVNQYRHPETHRCRLLVTQSATVAVCKDGQYRSEETNRCRTIALGGGTLLPCKDNQYRSEETNRCRNLASTASTLTPCKDNQYRSEATNRCRTITTSTVPAAAFAVQPIAETGRAFVGWWVLGGIGTLAVGYGVWEWRRELVAVGRRVVSFFTQQ